MKRGVFGLPMLYNRFLPLGVAFSLLFASCALTKHIQEGDYLLSRVNIHVDSLSSTEREELGELSNLIPHQPNRRFLGLFRWTLALHNLNNPKSNSFINRQLRRWGDAPVIFNPTEAEFGRANLTAMMYNLGYLNAETTLQVDTTRPKQAFLTYSIRPGKRLTVGRYEERPTDSTIQAILHPQDTLAQKRLFPGEQYRSHLHAGAILSPKHMRAEQERVTELLRNRGYYSFTGDSIHFEVDTLYAQDIWVRSRIAVPQEVYRIGQVSLLQRPRQEETPLWDTEREGIHFRLDGKHYIRPAELARRIWVRPGELYSMRHTAATYSALSELPTIHGISIQYHTDSLSGDSTLLNCEITTNSAQTKSISGDIVGTNSSGSLGVSSSLAFSNNNLFHGGEQLRIQLRGGYESLRGRAYEHRNYGAEASLSLPRVLLPFRSSTRRPSAIQSSTTLQVSFDHHTRPEFSRDIFSLDWGYSWHSLYSPAYRHQLKVINMDFLHFGYINEDFRRSMPLVTQILNYRDQFVFGASYLFKYNSLNDYRIATSPWVHNIRLFLQTSGNLLYGISKLWKRQADSYGTYRFFGTDFAQFVKAEIDYSGLRKLGTGNAFAYRLGLALAVPYGNSQFIPVELRYFAGGANSLRGWTARTLGPGAMPRSATRSIFDQVGDIKLEASAEYRMKILGPLQMALFADAGNIWTIRPYDHQPQGDFQWDRFYKEIALSSGLGLRWDFDYFVLRFDLGCKLYDPQVENGRPWVIGYQDPKQLLAINFAIGYPF